VLLAIDVGNTQILMGVYQDDELRFHWRLSTNRARTTDEFGILTRTLFNLEGLEAAAVHRIVVSSVVPPLDRALEYLGREYFNVEPLFVTPSLVHDMPVLYQPPGDVGSDRIVNGLASPPSWWTSAPPPPSTSSTPTAPTWAERSPPASASRPTR
jgi:type III pantothenate kinase